MALIYWELELMKFAEYEYCMKRKCKECKVNSVCDLLIKQTKRLTFKPFENINQLLKEKYGYIPR